MTFQERIKIFKRAAARYGLRAASGLITRLSYRAMRVMADAFIAIGFCFVIRQKKIAQESLQIAFGKEKSPKEIEAIARECFRNLGEGMIELIYFMAHPKFITEKVSFEGKEHLDAALKEGKGVIAISAHFGNFPLMLLRLAQAGYPTNAIIRPTRDKKIEEYFFDQRSKLGLNTIYSHPRKQCVDTSLKVLRNNELLFIPLDQHFGSAGGVFVDFFGRQAATATGPVVFAMRTKSPLLPMFIVRQKDNSHKIIIDPPLILEEKESDKETIFVNTSRITKVIERYIRVYPQEWGWMHRRWKSQSSEAPQPNLEPQEAEAV